MRQTTLPTRFTRRYRTSPWLRQEARPDELLNVEHEPSRAQLSRSCSNEDSSRHKVTCRSSTQSPSPRPPQGITTSAVPLTSSDVTEGKTTTKPSRKPKKGSRCRRPAFQSVVSAYAGYPSNDSFTNAVFIFHSINNIAYPLFTRPTIWNRVLVRDLTYKNKLIENQIMKFTGSTCTCIRISHGHELGSHFRCFILLYKTTVLIPKHLSSNKTLYGKLVHEFVPFKTHMWSTLSIQQTVVNQFDRYRESCARERRIAGYMIGVP